MLDISWLFPTIAKWNFETHEYEPYKVPKGWKVVLYSVDMGMPINCTGCGLDIFYGESYTSRQLHNHIGFGYPVCLRCYERELEEAREAEESENQ